MTTAYASMHGRSHASAPRARVDTVFDRIRSAWKLRRDYSRTLAELRALSPRMLRDVNLDTLDLAAVARREVYGS
ncbi:DUF1127 domain-containing protein [Amaricoccus sp.]|uniref:DUF1127 domain-containing protein n=1 Tax=Amaricoccus sp. TaxID=1872485 RepID=UPI001B648610|nr:DUF1127 domain-containing protein [Amaricoccus sp.]MBP7243292.1 DUF1127 domain-containing protein [Amaricoccus sp.]